MASELRKVMQTDRAGRALRLAKRKAPREYERLTAIYRPLVLAALDQPDPTPALRVEVQKIARELGLL